MRRAVAVLDVGTWEPARAVARVSLDATNRHRRRIRLIDEAGEAFLLDLPEAAMLHDGQALELDDGSGVIAIVAAPEPVADIACDDVVHLTRIAWHLGNRHLPVQVLGAKDGKVVVRIRDDHVIAAMAEGLGGRVTRHLAPFQPEAGAYAGGGHGHHHHDDDHDPDHDHGHDHGHDHHHHAHG